MTRCFVAQRCLLSAVVLVAQRAAAAKDSTSYPKHEAINRWDDQLKSWKNEGQGSYYEFDTAESDVVWAGHIEGKPGTWASAVTPFPLASASKLYTGMAAMITMQLKPDEFYPEKNLNDFPGYQHLCNFPIARTQRRANLTIHHLLTHTSGLPFGLDDKAEDLIGITLFFEPGTAFGYTIGHRIIGWLLRDFWRDQPETKDIDIKSVNDAYKWLLFNRLNLSCETKFDPYYSLFFGPSGEAGDAAITSTAEDFIKLAVLALRRGRLPDGTQLISEDNWNRWAVPNLLPGRKLSEDLVAWQGAAADYQNVNVGDLKSKIMKQSGPYGWNYFGATYNDSRVIGWCGFYSSCLRVSYEDDVAFVLMQRDVLDLKHSKKYLVRHFMTMAKSLQCSAASCESSNRKSVSLYCESCNENSQCTYQPWTEACDAASDVGKLIYGSTYWHKDGHTCYVPFCRRSQPTGNAMCRQDTGGTCNFWGCDSSRGHTRCVDHACLCQEGFCEYEGRCLRPQEISPCCQNTGGSCRFSGCYAWRGPTECQKNSWFFGGDCMCSEGYCAIGGQCIARQALERSWSAASLDSGLQHAEELTSCGSDSFRDSFLDIHRNTLLLAFCAAACIAAAIAFVLLRSRSTLQHDDVYQLVVDPVTGNVK